MTILTVNAGSSSTRLDAMVVTEGRVERVAAHHGHEAVADPQSSSQARDVLSEVLARWNLGSPDAVAHRVVHGGRRLVRPCLLTAAVEEEIERLAPLAPLHNPAALAWIRAAREVLDAGSSPGARAGRGVGARPGARASQNAPIPHVAVFDTGFYADLPEVAAKYALSGALQEKHSIRRYGFHGIAHEAMWRRWCALEPARSGSWPAPAPAGPRRGRAISIQLGAGCSITAVRDGKPVDTSMGFSPLEGLVMATRAGDVDPGLLLHLQRAKGMTPERLEHILNEESGLLGVSGVSADMRAVLESNAPAARQAVDLYCYRARKFLGGYLAVLGGVDAILFGGGVGENAPAVREGILAGLEWAGIALDPERNRTAVGREARIDAGAGVEERFESTAGVEMRIDHHRTGASVWVIAVDEAGILAEEAAAVIADLSPEGIEKERS